jgi:hypothetical protein
MPTHQGIRCPSVVHFLIALALLLIITPFVHQLRYGDVIEPGLVTLVFLTAVLAVGGRRRTLFLAAVLVTPPLIGTWIHHARPDVMPREFTLVAGMVFAAFVVVQLLGFILRSPLVNLEILCAAVVVPGLTGYDVQS